MEARSVIEVVEYDEAWPVRAAAARADLISLGVFDAVEHIGSTSVPGLGYRRFEAGMPGRLFYYRDEDGQRVPADPGADRPGPDRSRAA